MAFDIPEDIYAKVSPVANDYGVPDYIWASIGKMESNFDPRASGDGGKSYGLFQLYTNGGQGDPYKNNPDVLYDPALNAEVAMPSIAKAYRLGKEKGIEDGPELAAWVAGHSGHPGYLGAFNDVAAKAINTVKNYAQEFLGGGSSGGTQTGNAGSGEDTGLIDQAKDYLNGGTSWFDFISSMIDDPNFRNDIGWKVALVGAGIFMLYIGIKLVANVEGE